MLRETTESAETLPRSVMMSSETPSLKYSCSASPLILTNGRTRIAGFVDAAACCVAGAWILVGAATASVGSLRRSTKRRTSATKLCHAASPAAPDHAERSAVCVSSNMIGRSHGSIITGTSVLLRSPTVASARTQRDSTERFDHRTTTAFASFSAFSVTWS